MQKGKSVVPRPRIVELRLTKEEKDVLEEYRLQQDSKLSLSQWIVDIMLKQVQKSEGPKWSEAEYRALFVGGVSYTLSALILQAQIVGIKTGNRQTFKKRIESLSGVTYREDQNPRLYRMAM